MTGGGIRYNVDIEYIVWTLKTAFIHTHTQKIY